MSSTKRKFERYTFPDDAKRLKITQAKRIFKNVHVQHLYEYILENTDNPALIADAIYQHDMSIQSDVHMENRWGVLFEKARNIEALMTLLKCIPHLRSIAEADGIYTPDRSSSFAYSIGKRLNNLYEAPDCTTLIPVIMSDTTGLNFIDKIEIIRTLNSPYETRDNTKAKYTTELLKQPAWNGVMQLQTPHFFEIKTLLRECDNDYFYTFWMQLLDQVPHPHIVSNRLYDYLLYLASERIAFMFLAPNHRAHPYEEQLFKRLLQRSDVLSRFLHQSAAESITQMTLDAMQVFLEIVSIGQLVDIVRIDDLRFQNIESK